MAHNQHNPFIQKGKAICNNVREEIVERWLNGTGQRQIGRDLNIAKSSVQKNIDNICKRGHKNHGIGGNRIRYARSDDVLTYVEFANKLVSWQ